MDKTKNKNLSRDKGKGKARPTQQPRSVSLAVSRPTKHKPPQIRQGPKSMRIKHTEFLGTIANNLSVWTIVQNLKINPGLAATFPWLSIVAAGWERYKFHSLKFRYFSRSPASLSGSVQLIPEYDVNDAPPIGEYVANTYEGFSEDSVWKDIECSFNTRQLNAVDPTGKLVRTGTTANSLLQYDAAQFFVAVIGGPSAVDTTYGKLVVEYDVELMIPQMAPGGSALSLAWQGTATAPNSVANNILGVNPTINPNSMTDKVSVTGRYINFLKSGRYHVLYDMNGTTGITLSNMTLSNCVASPGIPVFQTGFAASPGGVTRSIVVDTTSEVNSFIQINDAFSGGTASGSCDVVVTTFPAVF